MRFEYVLLRFLEVVKRAFFRRPRSSSVFSSVFRVLPLGRLSRSVAASDGVCPGFETFVLNDSSSVFLVHLFRIIWRASF